MKLLFAFAATLLALSATSVSAATGSATSDDANKAAIDGLLLDRAGTREVSPLFAEAPLVAERSGLADAALIVDRKHRATDPLLVGLLAAIGVAAGLELLRRVLQGRGTRSRTALDRRFETHAFVVPANRRYRNTAFARPPPDVARAPTSIDAENPLHPLAPDAPPVATSPVDTSQPDYIRVDDAVEVWTPAKVAAERTSATTRRRRRSDPPGSDYRFHRLNGDGSIKIAQLRKCATVGDARKFAESIGQGDAVEVWLDDRRVSTIPATFG